MKKDIKNDWLQKGIESRKKMEQQREALARNTEILDKSSLLARNKKLRDKLHIDSRLTLSQGILTSVR